MTYGSCRVTVLDAVGRPYVADVNEGDLWYFPAGQPHSLQGLGPDGCEFVICFDDGDASEFNTLLVTDWFAHTPPEVLAKNFGVPAETFAKIPLQDLWIFQGTLPGDLESDRAVVGKTGMAVIIEDGDLADLLQHAVVGLLIAGSHVGTRLTRQRGGSCHQNGNREGERGP